jgi:hypothetical protein
MKGFAPCQRLTQQLPSYSKHKASGQARVTLNGADHYLGPWDSAASKVEYDRLTGEWLAAGRQPPVTAETVKRKIVAVLARYWPFAKNHDRGRDGRPCKELDNIRYAIRPLKRLYRTPAEVYGEGKRSEMCDAQIPGEAGLKRNIKPQSNA